MSRKLGGVSAYKLDQLSELTPGHTAAIERGKRPNLEVRTAQRIARALGVSLDWLVSGLGERPSEAQVRAAIAAATARRESSRKAA